MKEDKINGLKLGADDYIVKPFEADELVLRLSDILKRTKRHKSLEKTTESAKIGALIFNSERHESSYDQHVQKIDKERNRTY